MQNYFDMDYSKFCLTQSQIITHLGWSRAMIKKFMPNPCYTAINHVNSSWRKTKWYRYSRIELIEGTAEFHERMHKKRMRSKSARKGWNNRFKTENYYRYG